MKKSFACVVRPNKAPSMRRGLSLISLEHSYGLYRSHIFDPTQLAPQCYVKIKKEDKKGMMSVASKAVLSIRGLLVFSVRIMTTIAWFAPSLGLAGLLAHWQEEQDSLNEEIFNKYDELYNGTNLSEPFKILHRSRYGSGIPIPPAYTEYTGISLEETFFLFLLLAGIYSLASFLLKRKMSEAFRSAKWLSKAHHLTEMMCLPDCFEDWDKRRGSEEVQDYRSRWIAVKNETLAAIAFQMLSNLALLAPMLFTAGKVMQRHDLVTTYLEATPEEETAFSRMFLLAWLLPTIVLVASIVDFLLMYVYLKYLHPFKIIIEGNVTEEAPEVADQGPAGRVERKFGTPCCSFTISWVAGGEVEEREVSQEDTRGTEEVELQPLTRQES